MLLLRVTASASRRRQTQPPPPQLLTQDEMQKCTNPLPALTALSSSPFFFPSHLVLYLRKVSTNTATATQDPYNAPCATATCPPTLLLLRPRPEVSTIAPTIQILPVLLVDEGITINLSVPFFLPSRLISCSFCFLASSSSPLWNRCLHCPSPFVPPPYPVHISGDGCNLSRGKIVLYKDIGHNYLSICKFV